MHKSVNHPTWLRGSHKRGKFLSRCVEIVISDNTVAIYFFRFSTTVFHAKDSMSVIFGLKAKEAFRSLIHSLHFSNKKNDSLLYPQSPSSLPAESELSSRALLSWSGVLSAWGQVACIFIHQQCPVRTGTDKQGRQKLDSMFNPFQKVWIHSLSLGPDYWQIQPDL